MNHAYYIGFMQHYHLDDIDIGIGSIAYWESYATDAIVVAKTIEDARALFASELAASPFLQMETNATIVQVDHALCCECDRLDYQEAVIASCIDDSEQIIMRNSDHWLCRVVQHHPDIAHYARYYAGKLDRPLWHKAEAVSS